MKWFLHGQVMILSSGLSHLNLQLGKLPQDIFVYISYKNSNDYTVLQDH